MLPCFGYLGSVWWALIYRELEIWSWEDTAGFVLPIPLLSNTPGHNSLWNDWNLSLLSLFLCCAFPWTQPFGMIGTSHFCFTLSLSLYSLCVFIGLINPVHSPKEATSPLPEVPEGVTTIDRFHCVSDTSFHLSPPPPAAEPVVTLLPEHVSPSSISLGGVLTISPEITLGVPEAAISWSHDPPLDPSRVDNLTSPVLMVRNVMSSDRGVYTVTATSRDGSYSASDSGTVNVFVNCKDLVEPPKIGIFVSNAIVVVNLHQ